MELLHPGVYLQEVPSGVQPIEGVSTSTACFIGKAQMGPLGQAVMVTSMPEFTSQYGSFITDGTGFLAHSVLEFFTNGGIRTYVVRIAGVGAASASITLRDRKSTPLPQHLSSPQRMRARGGTHLTWLSATARATPIIYLTSQSIRIAAA